MEMTFRSLEETQPGAAWRKVFNAGWPGWKAWLRARQQPDAPDLAECERALRQHMPEFAPIWEKLVQEAGADEEAARFLSFWTPPKYLGACSQLALGGDAPLLIRNYDLDPRLNEATLYKTQWGGRGVIGMADGLCGLADGVNDAGLAVSLAYGGRRVAGVGFGVPLTVRYLLQVCEEVPQALEVLRALPHHMSYNLTLADKNGAVATAMIAPDREIIIRESAIAANHQLAIENPARAAFSRTEARLAALESLKSEAPDRDALIAAFQSDPLYNTQFEAGFGTVYTAAYEPKTGHATLIWPGRAQWRMGFEDFRQEERRIIYPPAGAAADPLEGAPVEALPEEWIKYVPQAARRWLYLGIESLPD